MKNSCQIALLVVPLFSIATLAQAQTTRENASTQLSKIISSKDGPRSFRFCDADKSTGKCKNRKGLRAIGLGGAFLPLSLEVKGFRVTNRKTNAAGTSLATKFDTLVNGIAPRCKESNLDVSRSSRKLEFKGFYCNWLAIGNVVARVTLDVDQVDARTKSFSGKYTLRLVGTGNMFGKGRFVASAQ